MGVGLTNLCAWDIIGVFNQLLTLLMPVTQLDTSRFDEFLSLS